MSSSPITGASSRAAVIGPSAEGPSYGGSATGSHRLDLGASGLDAARTPLVPAAVSGYGFTLQAAPAPQPPPATAGNPAATQPAELKGVSPAVDRLRWDSAKTTSEGREVSAPPGRETPVSKLKLVGSREALEAACGSDTPGLLTVACFNVPGREVVLPDLALFKELDGGPGANSLATRALARPFGVPYREGDVTGEYRSMASHELAHADGAEEYGARVAEFAGAGLPPPSKKVVLESILPFYGPRAAGRALVEAYGTDATDLVAWYPGGESIVEVAREGKAALDAARSKILATGSKAEVESLQHYDQRFEAFTDPAKDPAYTEQLKIGIMLGQREQFRDRYARENGLPKDSLPLLAEIQPAGPGIDAATCTRYRAALKTSEEGFNFRWNLAMLTRNIF